MCPTCDVSALCEVTSSQTNLGVTWFLLEDHIGLKLDGVTVAVFTRGVHLANSKYLAPWSASNMPYANDAISRGETSCLTLYHLFWWSPIKLLDLEIA